MMKFEVGKSYYTRFIGNYDSIVKITIAKRTEKMITTTDGKRLRVSDYCGVEQVKPLGSYSMCPIIGADKEYREETPPVDTWKRDTEAALAYQAKRAAEFAAAEEAGTEPPYDPRANWKKFGHLALVH